MKEEPSSTQAGRGGLAVLVAKVFFLGTGLVQQALLPGAIGLADYGVFSRVLAVSNVLNNVLVSSSTQGVSRAVAAAEDGQKAFRATLRVHAVIAVMAALGLGIAAPFIARVQHAPDMLAPLLVMTGVLGIYGVYAPLVGYLNGRREFLKQASLDIVAATLRTGGLLGVGWLARRVLVDFSSGRGTSPGVLGATLGAVGAALGVFLLALRWTRTGETGGSARGYLGMILPVMLAQLFTNGLMQADILVLARSLSIDAPAAVLVDPARVANEWVGVYRACQLFAFLPYQLLFSVTQVLFPMLAKAKSDEPERVPELVRRGCRIGALVAGLLVCVVVALPRSLLTFAYGSAIAARGVSALSVLGVGQACFAMFALATTVLVSLGRERTAMALTALALTLLGIVSGIVVPRADFGAPQLLAAAAATSCALGIALVIAGVVLARTVGAFVPAKTAAKVAAAVALAWGAHFVEPHLPRLVAPMLAAVVATGYLGLLVMLRELGRTELGLVVAIFRRRR